MAVLTVPEAKQHLNISVDTHDDEISVFIAAAVAALTAKVGPLEPVDKTARVDGRARTLCLPVAPAISLTSVTAVDGSAVTVGDLYLNGAAGTVVFADGTSWFPSVAYTVVYKAGRTSCPEDLLQAVRELVRHLWDTQRAPSSGRPGSSAESLSNTIPGAHTLFPFRIEQLIAPHLQVSV